MKEGMVGQRGHCRKTIPIKTKPVKTAPNNQMEMLELRVSPEVQAMLDRQRN